MISATDKEDGSLRIFLDITQGQPDRMISFSNALKSTLDQFGRRCFTALETEDDKELLASFHFIKPTCAMFKVSDLQQLINTILLEAKPLKKDKIREIRIEFDRISAALLSKVQSATEDALSE